MLLIRIIKNITGIIIVFLVTCISINVSGLIIRYFIGTIIFKNPISEHINYQIPFVILSIIGGIISIIMYSITLEEEEKKKKKINSENYIKH